MNTFFLIQLLRHLKTYRVFLHHELVHVKAHTLEVREINHLVRFRKCPSERNMSLQVGLKIYICTPFPVYTFCFVLQVKDGNSQLPTLAAIYNTSFQVIFMAILYCSGTNGQIKPFCKFTQTWYFITATEKEQLHIYEVFTRIYHLM